VTRALVIAATFVFARTAATHAQLLPEARVDVMGPKRAIVSPALGLTAGFGYYARVTALAGFATTSEPTFLHDRWRGEVLARFLFDPFRQQRWGFSIGGGLSVRRRIWLALVAELEGPAIRGVTPALQAGVAGGARAGLVLRRATSGRR